MPSKKTEKTTLNLPANITGALCYVPWIGWVVAIVVLLLEKNSEVRWHALHGLLLAAVIMILGMALAMTIILSPLVMIVWVGGLIAQVYAAVKVYNGDKVKFWKVSEWTDKIMKKI